MSKIAKAEEPKKPETEEKTFENIKARTDESSDEREEEDPKPMVVKNPSPCGSARALRERPVAPIVFTAEAMAMKLPGNARVIRPLPSSLSLKNFQKKGLIAWDGKG